jgi:hypothetical protein
MPLIVEIMTPQQPFCQCPTDSKTPLLKEKASGKFNRHSVQSKLSSAISKLITGND